MIEHDVNDHDMQMLTLERQRVLWRLNGEYILNTSNLNKYHKMDTKEILKLESFTQSKDLSKSACQFRLQWGFLYWQCKNASTTLRLIGETKHFPFNVSICQRKIMFFKVFSKHFLFKTFSFSKIIINKQITFCITRKGKRSTNDKIDRQSLFFLFKNGSLQVAKAPWSITFWRWQ